MIGLAPRTKQSGSTLMSDHIGGGRESSKVSVNKLVGESPVEEERPSSPHIESCAEYGNVPREA